MNGLAPCSQTSPLPWGWRRCRWIITAAYKLTIGENTNVALFAELDQSVLIVVPLGPLPPSIGYGLAFWLLRQSLYTSDLAPFTLACDEAGTLLLWGRVPLSELSGATLASLVDAVAAEARRIQEDIASV